MTTRRFLVEVDREAMSRLIKDLDLHPSVPDQESLGPDALDRLISAGEFELVSGNLGLYFQVTEIPDLITKTGVNGTTVTIDVSELLKDLPRIKR